MSQEKREEKIKRIEKLTTRGGATTTNKKEQW